jgi:hypothetical protein
MSAHPDVLEWVRRTRSAQGLAPTVDDPVALRKLAALFGPLTPSRRRVPESATSDGAADPLFRSAARRTGDGASTASPYSG